MYEWPKLNSAMVSPVTVPDSILLQSRQKSHEGYKVSRIAAAVRAGVLQHRGLDLYLPLLLEFLGNWP